MSWTVRPIGLDEAELAAFAAVVNAVTPESPASVEELRWSATTYPGGQRFVVEDGGATVGAATVGRIFMYPPEFERLWLNLHVLPSHRRRGIGTALLAATSAVAREQGKTGFQTSVSAIHQDGIAFLEHRGFAETGRDRMVRLELAGLTLPDVPVPDGIALTTLAARPDLVAGVHAVAVATFPDIPVTDEPIDPGTLDEFRKRDVERPGVPADGFFVAIDRASGSVVGYAGLQLLPGRDDVAWHDMTAVLPPFRGRGIAKALKVATIRWALDRGLAALETGNDPDNAPMRAINLGLGYQPMPDEIELRGPLSGPEEAA